MPAKKKVTREDIIQGAVEVLREEGYSGINARNVAKRLGCSTQPLYFAFRNMEELREELQKQIVKIHNEKVLDVQQLRTMPGMRYRAYGMGLIRFAREEKQLFRYLYLEKGEEQKRFAEENLDEVVHIVQEEYGYDEETARNFHWDMSCYGYGMAVREYIGITNMTEEELEEAYNRQFHALIAYYGLPPKFQEKKR